MSQTAEAPESRSRVGTSTLRGVSGLAVLFGAWLVASPFVFEATEMAMWNNIIVGLAVIILAGFGIYRPMFGRLSNMGVSALVLLLGIWALVVSFVIDMGSDEMLWATAIAGLLIALLSGYHVYARRRAQVPADRTRV